MLLNIKPMEIASTLIDRIVQKLQLLPEPMLKDVLNFVDFLTWRKTREHPVVVTLEEPLLSVAGILSGDPLTSNEIDAEIYGD